MSGSASERGLLLAEGLSYLSEEGYLSLLMIVVVHGQLVEDDETYDDRGDDKEPEYSSKW